MAARGSRNLARLSVGGQSSRRPPTLLQSHVPTMHIYSQARDEASVSPRLRPRQRMGFKHAATRLRTLELVQGRDDSKRATICLMPHSESPRPFTSRATCTKRTSGGASTSSSIARVAPTSWRAGGSSPTPASSAPALRGDHESGQLFGPTVQCGDGLEHDGHMTIVTQLRAAGETTVDGDHL